MIFNVSNAAQLQTALASARGGDTISLAAGNYGRVVINNRNYSSAIAIKSASGTSAHFDGLLVERSSFINFQNLDLGRALGPNDPEYTKLNTVQDSRNIKMTNVSIHGSLDNDSSNDGIGLFVNRVTGFELTGSSVEQVFRAVLVQQSYDVEVSDTRFNEMRSDGINISAAIGVMLDGNSFTNFRPVGSDHADAIQFWNVGQPFGSKDIVIKNNVVMNGTGFGPQGIFMNAANGWDYTNVLIENNMIYSNDSYHGIHVEGGNNVRIVGNTTLSHQLDREYMWINVADVSNINISNNLTERLIIGAGVTGLTQSNNQSFWTNPSLRAQFPNLNDPRSLADLILPNVGYQVPNGGGGGAGVPPANEQLISIFGTEAPWETIRGTSADEKIYGIPQSGTNLGKGTRDRLYGGGGADLFVLGDERGLFYDDKSATSAGRADYAAILDFGVDDKIQLVGEMQDYIVRQEKINGILGTSILRDDNNNGKFDALDEYIAHVSGSAIALALNAGHFIFVSNEVARNSTVNAPEPVEQIVVAPIVDESAAPPIVDFVANNLPAPISRFAVDYFTALP